MHRIAMFAPDGSMCPVEVPTVERIGQWALHVGANVLEARPGGEVTAFVRADFFVLDHLPTGLGLAAAPSFAMARTLLTRVALAAPTALSAYGFGQIPDASTVEFVHLYALIRRIQAGA